MKEVYAILGIKKVSTAAYNQQANGTVERMTRSPVTVLMIDGDRKVVSKQPFASFPKVNSLQS